MGRQRNREAWKGVSIQPRYVAPDALPEPVLETRHKAKKRKSARAATPAHVCTALAASGGGVVGGGHAVPLRLSVDRPTAAGRLAANASGRVPARVCACVLLPRRQGSCV